MARLLSRYAECTFWFARYMERVENTARVLEVTETFARDRDGRNWPAVVRINADEERFFKTHAVADAGTVHDFYLRDADNPTSVPFAARAARENARTIRAALSIATWRQINTFRNRMLEVTPDDIRVPNASRLIDEIRQACAEHSGIIEATFFRDEAWSFYQLGRNLERADQTTRLIDIKYHLLLPSVADVGSAIDLSQWNAVLRAATGYQAFRRVYSDRMSPAAVAGFLLLNDSFPRSVVHCLNQVDWYLGQMRIRYGARGGEAASECLDELRAALTERSIDGIIARGLHEFIDWCQIRLGFVAAEIAKAYFFRDDAPPTKAAALEQAQA